MKNNQLIGLIKIGQKSHIEDLCYNGTIYMNNINSFKTIEDNFLRGDIHEGRHNIKQGDFLKLKINDEWLEFDKNQEGFNCQLYYEYDNTSGNIFSLYSLRMPENSNKIEVDDKNLDFGDFCLLIYHVDEFMERVKKIANQDNIKLKYGFVEYYDYKTFSGRAGVYHKSNKFEYQNEFRLFIEKEGNDPLILKIGSIADIAKIFDSKDLLDITVSIK